MASKNVQKLQALVEAFNKNKDIDAIGDLYAEQSVLIDHARGETVKGRAAVKENWQMWATAFSNGKLEELRFVDGGDTVVLYFTGRGKNDGPLGPLPATGKPVTLPYCSIFAFDSQSKIIEEEDYWDQLGFLVQLGHMQPPQM
jgi:steroid delta-isomerase-like uncharacterized protein